MRLGSAWSWRAGGLRISVKLACVGDLGEQKFYSPPCASPGKTAFLGSLSGILFYLKRRRPSTQILRPECKKVLKMAVFRGGLGHFSLTATIWASPGLFDRRTAHYTCKVVMPPLPVPWKQRRFWNHGLKILLFKKKRHLKIDLALT